MLLSSNCRVTLLECDLDLLECDLGLSVVEESTESTRRVAGSSVDSVELQHSLRKQTSTLKYLIQRICGSPPSTITFEQLKLVKCALVYVVRVV